MITVQAEHKGCKEVTKSQIGTGLYFDWARGEAEVLYHHPAFCLNAHINDSFFKKLHIELKSLCDTYFREKMTLVQLFLGRGQCILSWLTSCAHMFIIYRKMRAFVTKPLNLTRVR